MTSDDLRATFVRAVECFDLPYIMNQKDDKNFEMSYEESVYNF
jgi:hypothetical protein